MVRKRGSRRDSNTSLHPLHSRRRADNYISDSDGSHENKQADFISREFLHNYKHIYEMPAHSTPSELDAKRVTQELDAKGAT